MTPLKDSANDHRTAPPLPHPLAWPHRYIEFDDRQIKELVFTCPRAIGSKPCCTKSMAGISRSSKGFHTIALVPTGRTMAEAVHHRGRPDQSPATQCDFCGGPCDTGIGFPRSTSFFPYQGHSTNSLYSFMYCQRYVTLGIDSILNSTI